jgi:IgA Peptidase M64
MTAPNDQELDIVGCIPSKQLRDSGCHARTGQRAVCNKGYSYDVTVLTPQATLGGYLHTRHITRSHAARTDSVPEHRKQEAVEDSSAILYGPSSRRGDRGIREVVMKKFQFLCGMLLVLLATAVHSWAACTAPTCTKIVDNGPDAGKKILVVMGDGYASGDQTKYNTDVDSLVVNGVFGNDFFHEEQNGFNVYRLNLVSTESGSASEYTTNMERRPIPVMTP